MMSYNMIIILRDTWILTKETWRKRMQALSNRLGFWDACTCKCQLCGEKARPKKRQKSNFKIKPELCGSFKDTQIEIARFESEIPGSVSIAKRKKSILNASVTIQDVS